MKNTLLVKNVGSKLTHALVIFSVLLSLCGSSIPAHAAVSTWQKAAYMNSTSPNDLASSSFQKSVDNLAQTGANKVILLIQLRQTNLTTTDITASSTTPTDAALLSAINYIHAKGMQVGLSLHDDSDTGVWRAFINPLDRVGWFMHYGSFLNKYAVIAQQNNVKSMIIGTEYIYMTSPSVNATNTANWQGLIRNVRARFAGTLTYSAQPGGNNELTAIGFWPQLDQIGISAYYRMTTNANPNPTIATIKQFWDYWNKSEITPIALKYHKPIIFAEVGYASRDGALASPGSAWALTTPANPTLQANGYQGLFEYWNTQPLIVGINLWNWSTDPNAGGANDTDYIPQNKPAQQIMTNWFRYNGQPQPAASFTSSLLQPGAAVVVGASTTISAQTRSSQPVNGKILDYEIFDANGARVNQAYFVNQVLDTTVRPNNFNWTPPVAGTYTVWAGVFEPNWSKLDSWKQAGVVVVH